MSSRTVRRLWRQRTGMNTTPSYILLPKVSSSLDPLRPILSSALSLALTSTGMTAEQRPLPQTQCLCSCSHFKSAPAQHRDCAALLSAEDFTESSAFGADDSPWLGNRLGSLSGMERCQLFVWIFRCIHAIVMTLLYICLEPRISLEMKANSTASYMCQGDLNIQQDTGMK